MMPPIFPESQQDTIPAKNIPVRDSVSQKSDTSSFFIPAPARDSVQHSIKYHAARPAPEIVDTISVCRRNSIEDVTFYDSNNLITRIKPGHTDNFPFLFTAKGKKIGESEKAFLEKHLRPGEEAPSTVLHGDWIILIILFSAFLFGKIRKSSGSIQRTLESFFMFRGVNDPSAVDTGGLFTWESTLKNLISFFVLGLFCYSAASIYNLIPSSVSGAVFWLISVLIIISAVTIRHLICVIAGSVSREREVFLKYLVGIYQFYRFSAISLFVVSILISYTTILPVKVYFIAGVIILMTLYFIRVVRLFFIFVKKNISLFYLILYLCALEILPVFISVKYISGLG